MSLVGLPALVMTVPLDSCVDPEGERGSGSGPPPPPLKKHKNTGCLNNTGLDTLKITRLPS